MSPEPPSVGATRDGWDAALSNLDMLRSGR